MLKHIIMCKKILVFNIFACLYIILFAFVANAKIVRCKDINNATVFTENCPSTINNINGFAIVIYKKLKWSNSINNEVMIGNFHNGSLAGHSISRHHTGYIEIGLNAGSSFMGGIVFGDKTIIGETNENKWITRGGEDNYLRAKAAYDYCLEKMRKYSDSDREIINEIKERLIEPSFKLIKISYDNNYAYDIFSVLASNSNQEVDNLLKENSRLQRSLESAERKTKKKYPLYSLFIVAGIVWFLTLVFLGDDESEESLKEKEKKLKNVLKMEKKISDLEVELDAERRMRKKYKEMAKKG